jgi:hypothetical protein
MLGGFALTVSTFTALPATFNVRFASEALLAKVIPPFTLPKASGAKVTGISMLCPGPRVCGGLMFETLKPRLLIVTFEILTLV